MESYQKLLRQVYTGSKFCKKRQAVDEKYWFKMDNVFSVCMALSNISAIEYRVMWIICFETFGQCNRQDKQKVMAGKWLQPNISKYQLAKMLNTGRINIKRAIMKLSERKMIKIIDNKNFELNMELDEWRCPLVIDKIESEKQKLQAEIEKRNKPEVTKARPNKVTKAAPFKKKVKRVQTKAKKQNVDTEYKNAVRHLEKYKPSNSKDDALLLKELEAMNG